MNITSSDDDHREVDHVLARPKEESADMAPVDDMQWLLGLKAFSVPQPQAEAIIRGVSPVQYETRPTGIRGQILVYASTKRYRLVMEKAILEQYGITDVALDDLPRGVLIGTVELWNCTGSARKYEWHFRRPERFQVPLTPKNPQKANWFRPF